jgi:hypothetical protein
MSDFGELCPLFNTGVYNELYLGRFATSVYFHSTTLTLNLLSSASLPPTAPSSLRLGRTVVVTGWWTRKKIANNNSATVNVTIGRRTGSGTAAASLFGTATFSVGITAFPDIVNAWRAGYMTACMTLHTADCLNFSNSIGEDDGPTLDIIIQYREK